MKLSIIIVNQSCLSELEYTFKSLFFQSDTNFEIVVVDCCGSNNQAETCLFPNCSYILESSDFSFYQLANIGIQNAIGEYCIILSGGDQLANDHVVEELYLNQLDKDIVFCNLKSIGRSDNEELFMYNSITASTLIFDTISIKSAILNRNLLLEFQLFDEQLFEMASWHFYVKSILANAKTFKHINMFLVICKMDNSINNIKTLFEFEEQVKKILPEILPLYAQNYIDFKNFKEIQASDDFFVLEKIAKTSFFKSFIKIRTYFLKHGIYFAQKAYYRKKMLYRQIRNEDKKKRIIVDELIQQLPKNLLKRSSNSDDDIIVSLTSYGHRVYDSVPYALYTLFTQTVLPNRIILYLGEKEWNDDNIPDSLKRLKYSGLEIHYCEDLRSYKKLIPAMKEFPNNAIITFDDDVYYADATIQELLDEYDKSDKKTVICHRGAIVERRYGEFIPYNKWRDYIYGNQYSLYSPIGVAGVLYPGKMYDDEILNKNIFLKYAPFADDLWFWLITYKLNIKINNVMKTSQDKSTNVDTMEQLIPKNSTALNFINFVDGANDTQLKSLLEYYGMK